MFEAKCPSCSSSYQVDERRVPPTGLRMRCPKCGESFQVNSPVHSEPPVLGAALGLKQSPATNNPPARHKKTMLGVAAQGAGSIAPPQDPLPAAAPPRASTKKTMMGVAPSSGGFELASLDDDEPLLADDDEFDLTGSGEATGELDLGTDALDDGGLDLPSPSNRAPRKTSPIELPSLSDDDLEEADLPDLSGVSSDLPSPSRGIGLPDLSGEEVDLPSPRRASPDLDADLPDLSSDLPELGGAGLPDLAAGLPDLESSLPVIGGNLPNLSADLPTRNGPALRGLNPFGEEGSADGHERDPDSFDFSDSGDARLDLSDAPPVPHTPLGEDADDIFGQGPTHAPASIRPPTGRSGSGSEFGEVDLTGNAGAPASDKSGADEFDAFPTEESGRGSGASVGGAQGYGDVSLEGDGGALDLGEELDRDASPARGAAATAHVRLPTAGEKAVALEKEKEKVTGKKKRRKTSGLSRTTRVALAGLLVFAVGGGALALVPEFGPYGAYLVIDTLKADEHAKSLATDIAQAQELLKKDTASDVSRAFAQVDSGRARAPRYKDRIAFAAYIGFFHQLRFGASTNESTQAQVLLDDLKDADPTTRFLPLAQLAQQAATEDPEGVAREATRHIQRGVDFAAVVGWAALRAQDGKTAQEAFQVVLKEGPSARGHFGMASALGHLDRPDEAKKHMDQALRLNPSHAGARLLLAELQLRSRKYDQEIVKNLTPLAEGKGASLGEQVSALVLLGELHLSRARLKKAEASFQQALKLNSGSASAQRGLAQTLFESGRISEALARFEASLKREPKDLSANLGLVKCKLRLEQLQDAVKHLALLKKEHPKSAAVAYWEGRGRESVGEKEEAEKAYQNAIDLTEDSEETVLAYISLTRLLGQKGNHEEASKVIEQAEKRFPDDPAVYEALGDLSTSRGSFDEAVADYDKALALDPENVGLRFARGIALRRARRFEEAAKEFDAVEKESPDYPGLALERGNLYQAAGQSSEALKAYEKALAAAPADKDLMLSVACGRAEAGQSEPALKLLEPLLSERANSAEVNFCQGLALLNKQDFNQAETFLERAVSQDASRAKYHLYVGWVALEKNNLPQAQLSLNKTIEMDRTLADAYWKRGELRVKTAAVQDALLDLNKALEMAPHRREAHAASARAYEQIGKEQDAIASWERAVGSENVDPVWHYQYGKLLFVNQRIAQARDQLEKSVTGAKKATSEGEKPPTWLPDAQRYLAMSIGKHKDAIEHWQAYLKARQGSNEPYIREALDALNQILAITGN